MAAGVLKTIVVVLAVLIFLALALVVWRILSLAGDADGPGFGEVSLGLPADCRIAGVVALDGRLAILTDGPACNDVHIVDAESGASLGRITP